MREEGNSHEFLYAALRSRRGTRESFCFICPCERKEILTNSSTRRFAPRRGTRESFCFIAHALWSEILTDSATRRFARRGTRESFCFIAHARGRKFSRIPLRGASLVEKLVRVSVSFAHARGRKFSRISLRGILRRGTRESFYFIWLWSKSSRIPQPRNACWKEFCNLRLASHQFITGETPVSLSKSHLILVPFPLFSISRRRHRRIRRAKAMTPPLPPPDILRSTRSPPHFLPGPLNRCYTQFDRRVSSTGLHF